MINLKDLSAFPKLLQDFAQYKLVVQGCSPKTVTEYLFDMRTFCRYFVAKRTGEETDGETLKKMNIADLDLEFFKSLSEGDIYEFLFFTKSDRDNESSSRARKLSAIKSFYKYLVTKKQYFETNPAINIETPKKKKQLPKHLSIEECVDLLTASKSDPESKTKERDYCILTLFLNCGMRLSELVGINLPDIDRDLESLKVMGKGSKERIIYLNDACRSALSDYLAVRPQSTDTSQPLFISRLNKRISVKTVQWLVKKYLDEAGLSNKNYSTHKLRHTAATLMYQSGKVDVRVLKDILGHEQLNTTQIYTHVSNPDMEKAMQSNPLSDVVIKEKKHLD